MNGFQWKQVQRAVEQSDRLTDYEAEFAEDMEERGPDYELSDKQSKLLNNISEKLI